MRNSKIMTSVEKEELLKIATQKLVGKGNQPVFLETDMTMIVGLIGQLQLAFRHPQNISPTREMLERFVRDLIEQIDPAQGDIYEFLMLGFNEEYDI